MRAITVQRVLEVARDFDLHGGVSAGLLAWELNLELGDVSEAWHQALAEGLLEQARPADLPPVLYELEPALYAADEDEEVMRQLSRAGWARLGVDPEADRKRAAAVSRLDLLGTDAGRGLEALVRVAGALLGTQACAVHIFDERYQHRIAAAGAPLGTHRSHDSFCRQVVDSGEAIATGDATLDDRFAYSTFVRGDQPVRFYASAPLLSPTDDLVVGTLCVFDSEARAITDEARRRLADLAEIANAYIELAVLRSGPAALRVAAPVVTPVAADPVVAAPV